MSEYFPQRRCSECQYEKECRIDELDEKQYKREIATVFEKNDGPLPTYATQWLTER